MQKITEQFKTLHGFTMHAFKDDEITKSLKLKGVYDVHTLQSILDMTDIFKPEVTLDIGANIGNHALVLSTHSKNVYAFEPVQHVYEVLTKNIATNHRSNILAFQIALSDSAGSQTIYLNESNIGSSSLNPFENASDQQTINTAIGDDFLKAYSINTVDFIKIDVEGFEGQVIAGLQKTIKASRPTVVMEWKSPLSRNFFKDHAIFETVFADYRLFSLGHSTSKKSIGRGLINTLKRLRNKLFGGCWGLYAFDSLQSYSNIYLIPDEKIEFVHALIKV